MDTSQKLKERLYQHCLSLIDEKIQLAEEELRAAKEAQAEDGKSSMGDKYETSKAMLDLEKEKLQKQRAASLQLKRTLLQLNPELPCHEASFGSLVNTDSGRYFLSVGLGRIFLKNRNIS